MKIVRNVCMTQLNKSNASKVVYIDSQILKRKVHQYQRDGASEYASPEMDAIALTEANKIHDAIAQLSIEYREIILLREFQDFSYKQIAEVTTLPVGTVMSRLSRARRDLRNILSADVKQEKGA
jgi:RNA polymerase sigma-70 factor (ECF subfamily)